MVNNFPTVETYWENLQLGYADENDVCNYAELEAVEAANVELISVADESFVMANAEVGSVQNIAGLVSGTTTVDDLEYENVKIILTEQNPKAILSLGVTVTPKAYYTAGYEYKADAIVNAGVPLGLTDTSFMDHLQSLNSAPMGGGVYKFVEFTDGNVTLVRNDYHYTMGDETVTNAKIKNVVLVAIESGKEFDALKAGDVVYANPSASADVVTEIATINNLTSILVDNLGYGYICVNPAAAQVEDYKFNNIHALIALNAALDISKCLDYYPNGLADVICRSQSQVSWAYPEGAEPIYPFDESLATTISELQLAGYTYDAATGKFTDVPEIDFYVPGETDSHPAGGIYLRTQELLATIGVTINIKNDTNLLANVKDGKHPVYTMAWQSSQDPDMYQVYHYNSAAESVVSNGIAWLYVNGGDDALGTIDVVKLDGSTETMNQKQALEYLGYLIEQGTKYMSVEERKPIYEKALEILAQLAIEIPTYQRKNMFAYDNTVLDATTMSEVVTPYWGPLAEIWKLSFAN
jgi:peptide/nickel transport system substrate-binding protein